MNHSSQEPLVPNDFVQKKENSNHNITFVFQSSNTKEDTENNLKSLARVIGLDWNEESNGSYFPYDLNIFFTKISEKFQRITALEEEVTHTRKHMAILVDRITHDAKKIDFLTKKNSDLELQVKDKDESIKQKNDELFRLNSAENKISKKESPPESKKEYPPEPKKESPPESKKEYSPEPKKAYSPGPKKEYSPEPKKEYSPEPKKEYSPEPKKESNKKLEFGSNMKPCSTLKEKFLSSQQKNSGVRGIPMPDLEFENDILGFLTKKLTSVSLKNTPPPSLEKNAVKIDQSLLTPKGIARKFVQLQAEIAYLKKENRQLREENEIKQNRNMLQLEELETKQSQLKVLQKEFHTLRIQLAELRDQLGDCKVLSPRTKIARMAEQINAHQTQNTILMEALQKFQKDYELVIDAKEKQLDTCNKECTTWRRNYEALLCLVIEKEDVSKEELLSILQNYQDLDAHQASLSELEDIKEAYFNSIITTIKLNNTLEGKILCFFSTEDLFRKAQKIDWNRWHTWLSQQLKPKKESFEENDN